MLKPSSWTVKAGATKPEPIRVTTVPPPPWTSEGTTATSRRTLMERKGLPGKYSRPSLLTATVRLPEAPAGTDQHAQRVDERKIRGTPSCSPMRATSPPDGRKCLPKIVKLEMLLEVTDDGSTRSTVAPASNTYHCPLDAKSAEFMLTCTSTPPTEADEGV
jgi:hypothetical protein